MSETKQQIDNLMMQISALSVALRHACMLVPGLAQAVRSSTEKAEDELMATMLPDTSIEALAAQLMIICGPRGEDCRRSGHGGVDVPE